RFSVESNDSVAAFTFSADCWCSDQRSLRRPGVEYAIRSAIQRKHSVGGVQGLPARSWLCWHEGNEVVAGREFEPAGLQPRDECLCGAVWPSAVDAEDGGQRHSAGADLGELEIQLVTNKHDKALQPRPAVSRGVHARQIKRLLFRRADQRAV